MAIGALPGPVFPESGAPNSRRPRWLEAGAAAFKAAASTDFAIPPLSSVCTLIQAHLDPLAGLTQREIRLTTFVSPIGDRLRERSPCPKLSGCPIEAQAWDSPFS